jgi:signal transduction histidine kinase
MKPTFYFCDIGDATARRILELLQRGESVVILGPRGVGKRYLLDLINRHFERLFRSSVGHVGFSSSDVVWDEAAAVRKLVIGLKFPAPKRLTMEAWADQVQAAHGGDRPLRLFISNLDGLSKRLAHQLLFVIQRLVKAGSLIVAVTGEGNVIDLVDGSPTSAWNCAHQFVVHAHDRVHFARFVVKRMRQMGMRLPQKLSDAKNVLIRIYHLTGGNVSLARALLWSAADAACYHLTLPPKRHQVLKEEAIPEDLNQVHVIPTAGLVPFRYAVHAVHAGVTEPYPPVRSSSLPNKPRRVLADLERMVLENEEAMLLDDPPHLLELAGLARRRNGRLKWFCPYAEKFAISWFNARRLGDYYASAHDWESAHRLYATLPAEERCRPLSDEDNTVLLRLLDGLSVHFHRTVRQAMACKKSAVVVEILRKAVRDALKNLLGFADEDITCWEKNYKGEWVRINPQSGPQSLPAEVRQQWSLLAGSNCVSADGTELHGHRNGWHWIICRNAEKSPVSAILVDGCGDPLKHHTMRQAAIFRVFRGYSRARERQLLVQGLEEDKRRSQLETMVFKTFWRLTHSGSWDAGRALPAIATPLIETLPAISRLVFCELDTSTSSPRITPIYDSALPGVHTYQHAQLEMSLPLSDTLPTFNELSCKSANNWLAQTGVAEFKRSVLVLGRREVKGLLVLEFSGQSPLLESDMNFIHELVSRFVPVWAQAMRMKILHQSMDVDHTPKLLLDRRHRIIYANQPVIDRLQLRLPSSGWQEAPVEISTLGVLSAKQNRALTPTAGQLYEKVNDLTSQMQGTWIRECLPLGESGNLPKGWVINFRNRSFLFKSFELLSQLERCRNVKQALLILTDSLQKFFDHADSAKVRVYLVDQKDPRRLVSFLATGLKPGNRTRFEKGEVVFLNSPEITGWRCLRTKRQQSFRVDTDPQKARKTDRTKGGLDFEWIPWSTQHEILEKEPGDLSIDFPLLSQRDVLGKLTINLNSADADKLSAEFPEQLAALSLVFGDLLVRQHKEVLELERRYQREAERAMSETAHNLVSRFAAVDGYVALLRLEAETCPEIQPITEDLHQWYLDAVDSIKRIKDRAGEVILKPQPCDLAAVISKAMNIGLGGNGSWEWAPGSLDQAEGGWDAHHWDNLLQEMIHNSVDFVRPGVPLKIILTLRALIMDGVPWLSFQYEDNGRGVRSEFKTQIFYGESHREDIDSAGSGVGLNYVRRVIEAHLRGTVEEKGLHGEGAVFLFSVPWVSPGSVSPPT